jgi:hypothetical protein
MSGEVALLAGVAMVWGIALGRRSMERAGLHPALYYAVAVGLTVLGVWCG